MKQFNVIQNRANQDIRRLRQLLAQNTSLPLQPQVRSSNPPVLSEYKYYTALLKDVTSVPPVDDAQPPKNVPVVPQPPGEAITSQRSDDKQVLSALLLTTETGSVPPIDDGTIAPVTADTNSAKPSSAKAQKHEFLVYPVQKLAQPPVAPLPQKSTSVSEHPQPTAPSTNLASKSPDLTGESSSSGSPQSSPDGQVVTLQPTLIAALSLQCYLDRRQQVPLGQTLPSPITHLVVTMLKSTMSYLQRRLNRPLTYHCCVNNWLKGRGHSCRFIPLYDPQVWCDWQPH